MKKTYHHRIGSFFLCVALVAIISIAAGSARAAPSRIAILPFKINAEKDLSFLKVGITDMLTSRLTQADKVMVIDREQTEQSMGSVTGVLNEAKARTIGRQLAADYVIFGSITVFGDSVSIDAKMSDVAGIKPTIALFRQSPTMNDVIPQINLFAAEINEKAFGRVMDLKQGVAAAQPKTADRYDSRAHPDKLLSPDGGFYSSEEDIFSRDSSFAATGGRPGTSVNFWKSRNFRYLINGLSVGDADGDGAVETVVITPHTVRIFKNENKKFHEVAKIDDGRQSQHLGVDVADINGNGFAEIFVTSLNAQRTSVQSFVVEFNAGAGTYPKIVEDSSWYYRVADLPNRGKILVGQRHKLGAPFSGSVHELTWDESDYVPSSRIRIGKDINIIGMTMGDVLNDGQETAVAYDRDDYIRIFEVSGREIWKGSDHYGGSTLYYSLPLTDTGQVENRGYFPGRLLVRKSEAGEKTEVITFTNQELARRFLEQFRSFSKSRIVSLSWDGLGLTTNWATRKISGAIRDLAIGDFDNDGTDELVSAVIIKEGAFVMTEPKSSLIAYDLIK